MSDIVNLRDTSALSLQVVRRYMLATGWRRLTSKSAASTGYTPFEMFAFSRTPSDKTKIILPTGDDSTDLRNRVRDAVQAISDIQSRSHGEVIDSILRVGYDVIRSSVPTEQVRDETIKLSSATDFIGRMRGLLATTATTEKQPRPFFGRLLKDSIQYADGCRFGHTYRGSFGFVLESPLPQEDLVPLLEGLAPTPFERRVVQRFAHGVANVVEANAVRDTRPLVEGVATGFSANGCEQFADLIEKVNPAGLTFSIDLSPEWGDSREMHNSLFKVSAAHVEICRSAARELRRDDTAVPVRVAGRVVRLQNQTDPTDLTSQTGEHEVMILWASYDYGDIQVQVNLLPADYLSAVGAHGLGRPVGVGGTLVRVGRQWRLISPHDFVVRQQEELDFEA